MNYEELVKALRCKRDDCERCDLAFFDKDEGWMCQYAAKDDDAADAIEALQAELEKKRTADCWGCKCEKIEPKRGEWIVREVDSPGEMHPVAFRCMCSMCLNEYVFPRIPKYCPDCGSMNTAKMEVSE